jgi:voltage-gated potassium channel
VSNPLLIFWAQLFGRRPISRAPSRVHIESSSQASSTIFLVMRRMRAPLIILIV